MIKARNLPRGTPREEHKMINFKLLKEVVEQIIKDAESKDYTAIEDLLKDIPTEKLKGFLEEQEDEH
mgnify:CR=1 FL=1